jgi:hypothetical protein
MDPTIDADGWTERYGCYSKSFGHFEVSISWSDNRQKPGYQIRVNGLQLKRMAPDVPTGKRWAIASLRKMLRDALAALPPVEPTGEIVP